MWRLHPTWFAPVPLPLLLHSTHQYVSTPTGQYWWPIGNDTEQTQTCTYTQTAPNTRKVNKYYFHHGEFYLVSWKQNETTHTGDETILPWLGGVVFNNLWEGKSFSGWAEATFSEETVGGEISVPKPPHRWRVKRGSERDRSWATAAWPFLRKCRSVTIDVFLKNELFKNVILWIHLLPLTLPMLIIRRLALNTQCSKSECESSHHRGSCGQCHDMWPAVSRRIAAWRQGMTSDAEDASKVPLTVTHPNCPRG